MATIEREQSSALAKAGRRGVGYRLLADLSTTRRRAGRPVPAHRIAAVPRAANERWLRIDSRRRWLPDLRATFRARQLLLLLCRRDITVMYRQTVLGSIWIVVAPLLSAGLFTFVFGQVAHLSTGGVPYFAFSYAGLLAWNLFSSTLTGAATSIVANSALFTRIHFPRLVLPLSKLAPTLINAAISCVVMFVLLVVYQIGFSLRLLLLPVWLLLAVLLSMGCSLVLSAVAVLYRDVQYVIQAIIPILMFLSPVAYSTDAVPESVRLLYLLNPVATIIDGCRWSLVGHTQLSGWAVVYTVATTFACLVVGLVVFARLENKFADVV